MAWIIVIVLILGASLAIYIFAGGPTGTVLLMGQAGDALIWPPEFVLAFVEAGYEVIRYDHRGTGISDWVESWDREKPYSLTDMAEVVLYDIRKRRGINLKAVFQHHTAVTLSGSRYPKLQTLQVPTLVIHGSADWLIPIEHGQKLVSIIPNTKGLWLEGVGHMFPYPNMAAVNEKIISHFENNNEA